MDYTQENADKIRWWHTMTLPGGVVTKGHHDPMDAFNHLQLGDLRGKDVADVGTWDGFFAFEAERRGARSVTAIDHHVWSPTPSDISHGNSTGRQGFDFAYGAIGSRVVPVDCDMLDLGHYAEVGIIPPCDVVIYSGVLYHMRHPLLALENLFELVKSGGFAAIETHLGADQYELTPAMEFYEGRELNNDPTNWCGPNPACVMAMARAAGFTSCRQVWRSGSRGVFHAVRS